MKTWLVTVALLTPTLAVGQTTPAPPAATSVVPSGAPAAAAAVVAEAQPRPDGAPSKGTEAIRLFGSLDDDRALVYVASGPPDARNVIQCSALFRPIEVWTYLDHTVLGPAARMLFYKESGTDEYRYWTVLEGDTMLVAPSLTGKTVPEVVKSAPAGSCGDALLVQAAWEGVTKRQPDKNAGLVERGKMAAPEILPATGPKTAPQPAQPELASNKPFTGRERRKAVEALPEKYRRFLEDVEPIITDLERDTLLRLASDYQREKFVEGFWKRRSVDQDGLRVPFKDVYELRLAQVKEKFRNPNTDMGRIFLVNGPPDAVRRIDCVDTFNPIEIWFYERMESIRMSKVTLLFYRSFGVGDYRIWMPGDGFQALTAGGVPGASGRGSSRSVDFRRCIEYREILAAVNTVTAALGSFSGKTIDEMKTAAKPDSEGVDSILQMTTDLAENATKLPVQRVLRFPEMVANKMRMELAVMLERETLAKKKIGDETFFDVDVVGEVIKDGRLVDNFRYRFDFPASSVNGPFIPLTIEREIYPGEYKLKVKVADANQNAGFLISETINVPEVPDASLTPEEKAAREAARQTIARLTEAPGSKGTVSLVPIAREIATGLIRFETRASSADVAFIEYYLNSTKVVTDRRAPFEADLDLGSLPRRHIVKVMGYGKDGKPIAEDELVLNEGRESFRVRITHPEKAFQGIGATRVAADVAVPETKRLKHVEIFVNESRVATLYQPPFEQVVEVPRTRELGYLRVLATLDDGQTTEDLRYFNAPKYLSEVNVQAVELYVSVFSKGKPVTGLGKEAFSVFEDGIPQNVDGFEIVTNLPLSVGIAVDTSGSMEEAMTDVQQAAAEFLKGVMTPRDRCFLVSFDNEPQLVTRFTTDRDKIAQALAGLRAQGSTALWDAIVYGLYQYQGTKGRKAYVVLTDGADRASKFTFEASLDYAKKMGVALYFIGMKVGGANLEARYKMNKMAKETGGAAYYVDSARGVAAIYKEIEEELRSQYLLSYVPQNKTISASWRKIEVKMEPSSYSARTISGYYP